jgi:hypothetical protein
VRSPAGVLTGRRTRSALDRQPLDRGRHVGGGVEELGILRPAVAVGEVGRVVGDNEQRPRWRDGVRRPAQHRPQLEPAQVQVEDRDEVEPALRGRPPEDVGLHPVHREAVALGPFAAAVERHRREVDRRHLPTARRQPERVSALAAGEVERAPGCERLRLVHQKPVWLERPQRLGRGVAGIPHLAVHARMMPARGQL